MQNVLDRSAKYDWSRDPIEQGLGGNNHLQGVGSDAQPSVLFLANSEYKNINLCILGENRPAVYIEVTMAVYETKRYARATTTMCKKARYLMAAELAT